MWANLSLEGKVDSSSATPSSSLLKLDNGKVFPAAMVGDYETKGDGIVAPRLEVDRLLFDPEINIHGNASTQPLMRSVLVVPGKKQSQFLTHGIVVERDEDTARAFGLDGPHKAFDDGDGAVLADGSEGQKGHQGAQKPEVGITVMSTWGTWK